MPPPAGTAAGLGAGLSISHAIPLWMFHAVIRNRWNSADSNVLWGCAVVELHAELGSSLFRGRAAEGAALGELFRG